MADPAPIPVPVATPLDDKIRGRLAIVTVVGFGSLVAMIIAALIYFPNAVNGTTGTMLGTILGILAANVKDVYNYYFGSSSGSTQKSATIAAAITNGK